MTTPTRGHPPSPEELHALLRLIDDETPEVRQQVIARFEACSGDISEYLASYPKPLDRHALEILVGILADQRRRIIQYEWQAPSTGASALADDWEQFEALLRTLSDFLHDGITCRQPLSDALDLLAEEHRNANDGGQLAEMLFDSGPLRGNHEAYQDPRNSDLAWCIAEGRSNPIGLCTIYILVARRLDLAVDAVNFPGHFLCRIHMDGQPILVDCFHGAKLHPQGKVLANPDLSPVARRSLKQSADPGTILMRILNNLNGSLLRAGRMEDAKVVRQLQQSLE